MIPSIELDGSTLIVKGEFTFDTITTIIPTWLELKKQNLPGTTLLITCEGVTKADSSFLALLIEMRRWADRQKLCWHLKQLPKSLEGFLSVYGIGSLIANTSSVNSKI